MSYIPAFPCDEKRIKQYEAFFSGGELYTLIEKEGQLYFVAYGKKMKAYVHGEFIYGEDLKHDGLAFVFKDGKLCIEYGKDSLESKSKAELLAIIRKIKAILD